LTDQNGEIPMKQTMMDCTKIRTELADLLLDPEHASALVLKHVKGCAGCKAELDELKQVMGLLDGWQTPEPSPFFMTRMEARLRAEREAEPAGWLARTLLNLRNGLSYGPRPQVRPVAAMALTVLMLVGSGAYMGLTDWNPAPPPAPVQTAVVDDLRTMDSNQQVLDRLESLSDSDDDSQATGNN